jgi:xanthine dehydrogenase accessory factor
VSFDYNDIKSLHEDELPAALCIVVAVKGSVPRRQGSKMLVKNNGEIKGTIGGGNLESQVIKDALGVIANKEPKLFKHDLLHQHEMCCGGSVSIYIEPIMKKDKLYIFGSGHTGRALAKIATMVDFETFLIDDRKEQIDQAKSENISVNLMCLSFDEALKLLPFDNQTSVAIMTYNHALDRDILFHCITKPFAYLGMIGSLRKVEFTKKMLRESEIADEEKINMIDMPMGIDIPVETPEEIAVSIAAKLIAIKRNINKPIS